MFLRLAAAALGLALGAPVAAQNSPGTPPSPAFQVIDQPDVPILNTTRYAIIAGNADIRLPRPDTLRAGHMLTMC